MRTKRNEKRRKQQMLCSRGRFGDGSCAAKSGTVAAASAVEMRAGVVMNMASVFATANDGFGGSVTSDR